MAAPAGRSSIEHLDLTWRSIVDLCGDLTDEEWARPTGCPGWSVQDQISHLIDYEAGALGRPRPDHVVAAGLDHLKNPLGEANEVGIDARRALPGAAVLAELVEVTAARLQQLQGLTDADFAREVTTPAGPGTIDDMLDLRVMDTWSHEQDVRRALGRPGHVSGPAADHAVDFFTKFLPFVVGKRAGAPDGSSVQLAIGDRPPIRVLISEGRGALVDASDGEPTVTLTMPVTTFAAVAGARSDVPGDLVITGDEDLGRRVLASLSVMP